MTAVAHERVTILLRASSLAPARTVTWMGRPFRVVPAVLVRSQVLNNNLGRTFLPPDQISQSWAEMWNGIPVLIGPHPTLAGEPISGRNPTIWDQRGAGWIFAAHAEYDVDGTRRLIGEVWLDTGRVDAVAGLAEVLSALDLGHPVELSTGFATDPIEQAGNFQGEPYDWVLHPLGADHLVVSTDFTGACSVQDGCGLGVNQECGGCKMDTAGNVLGSARTPSFSGTETTGWSAPSLADYVAGLSLGDVNSIADLSAAQKKRIAGHSLLGDPAGSTISELSFFPVVNPRSGKLNRNALRAVLGGRGSQAQIPAAAKASAQAKARSLLQAHFPSSSNQEEGNVERPKGIASVLSRVVEMFRTAEEEVPAVTYEDMLAANIGKAILTIHKLEPSDAERAMQIREALQAQMGSADHEVMVSDVYTDTQRVIFWMQTPMGPQPKGSEYFSATWTVGDNGQMTFADPVRVRRMTTYEPVTQTTPAANTDTGTEGEAQAQEVVQGDPPASAAGTTTEEDTDMAGNEKQFEDVLAAINTLGEQVKAIGEKVAKMEADGVTISGLKSTITALTEKVGNVERLTAPAVEERERERVALVQTLAGNHRVPFSVAQLESKPLSELRQIAEMAEVHNYSGKGGPRAAETGQQFADTVPYFAEKKDKE